MFVYQTPALRNIVYQHTSPPETQSQTLAQGRAGMRSRQKAQAAQAIIIYTLTNPNAKRPVRTY